jgi:hypothetical protein
MSNIAVLQQVFDRAGVLQDAWEARLEGTPHLVTELRLRFENLSLVLSADGEADTVLLWVGDFTEDADVVRVPVSESSPWSGIIGLGLRWGWELTNHQGYSDGIRFDFADPDMGVSQEVELIVAASCLWLYLCAPTSRLPNRPVQPPSGGQVGVE